MALEVSGGRAAFLMYVARVVSAAVTSSVKAFVMTSFQLFGTKKCPDTRKAERFFKERGVQLHVVDLAQKGLSPGELRNVAARVGGLEALIDRAGKRYTERGLKYAAPTGPRIETALLEDPLLLRTPIVRAGAQASVGYVPDVWQQWLAEAKTTGKKP